MENRPTTLEEFFLNGYIPPSDEQAECIVIGSLLLDFNSLKSHLYLLRREYFYTTKYIFIFDAILSLVKKEQAVDILSVTLELKTSDRLQDAGGAYEISQLTNRVGGSEAANFETHVSFLKQFYIKRIQARNAELQLKAAYDLNQDCFLMHEDTKRKAEEIDSIIYEHKAAKTIGEQLEESVADARIREDHARSNKITGIPTPLTKLTKATQGWQSGEQVVFAGRPGMGKTAIAISSTLAAADSEIDIYSLEMPAKRLTDRMIVGLSGIDYKKYKDGTLNQYDWNAILAAKERLSKLPIFIDDNPSATISYIRGRSRLRQMSRKKKKKLIIIDFLQIIDTSDLKQGYNRDQELSEITKQIKQISKECDCTVITLSQLSRAVETRGGDKRPVLSDLRESGAIEQNADIVIFIYRPWYYGFTEDDMGESTYCKGELIVAKHREGSTGDFAFSHNESLTQIYDYNGSPHSLIESNNDFLNEEPF